MGRWASAIIYNKAMLHERDFSTGRASWPAAVARNVKVLGWVSLCNDISSEMIFPLLPQFLLTVLKGNIFALGVIEGAVDSASSIVKLWFGGWSDRIGSRKGLVLFGYALAAVARPLVAIITAPWQLFGIRLADRVGKGVRNSPRDALIADSVAPEIRGRAFGFNRAMDHLGEAVGPILAAVFLLFWPGQYRPLFLLAAVPGLAVVLLLILGLREPAKTAVVAEKITWTLRPFGKDFRMWLAALVVFTLGNSSDAFLLVRAVKSGSWPSRLWTCSRPSTGVAGLDQAAAHRKTHHPEPEIAEFCSRIRSAFVYPSHSVHSLSQAYSVPSPAALPHLAALPECDTAGYCRWLAQSFEP